MQMRPQIQIKSVIKALTDVVLPAVDPGNKLAQEQGQLAIGLLSLMAQQLPLQFRFDCDELERLIDCSGTLQTLARGGEHTQTALTALSDATRSAVTRLESARVSPQDIEQQVRSLRSTIGTLVTEVYRDGEASCRKSVSDAVLALSKAQLLRDRSWLLMQGWEPDPKAIPPITQLLDKAAS